MGLLGDSIEDPRTMAVLRLAGALQNQRGGGFGGLLSGLNAGGQDYIQTIAAAKQQEEARRLQAEQRQMQQQLMQQQIAQAQQQTAAQAEAARRQKAIEQAYRGAIRTPEQQAMQQNGGPTIAAAQAAPGMQPGVDSPALIRGLTEADPMAAFQMMQPKPEDMRVIGDALVGVSGGKARELYRAQPKPAELPTSVREFQYGQQNPEYNTWATGQKRAGATNIGMPRIEVKMGDSVAGQIGPMAKDSRTQAQGAVGMFDSADRIQKALDSGKVSAGPLTTQINTVKQLVQKVGGGSDEGIRQTRQVIKSLAQMAVEARKELAGQGAVTENEAAAAAKAEAGDINDLTTGELQDLVTLTKRAAHLRAKSHQGLIESMAANEGTRSTVPFYQVRGLERLLQHSPGLPQIGGNGAQPSFDDAEKERRYQAWKQQQGRP